MNHKLAMERFQDSYDRVLKKDDLFSVEFKAWSLSEMQAQKIYRAISDILDGVKRE
jgi:hypothetical protein